REVALAAYSHQEAPFEKVVERLQPERSLNRAALVQVTLTVQNGLVSGAEMGGRGMRGEGLGGGGMEYDLSLMVGGGEGGIGGVGLYNQELYEEETMRRLMKQLERVLEGAGRNWEGEGGGRRG